MRLSDLKPEDVQSVGEGGDGPTPLKLSDLKPEDVQPVPEEGGFTKALKTIDSYTGGPVRAAIGAAQEGRGDIGKIVTGAASAFKNKFGNPDVKTPSGQEILERAGVPRTSVSDVLPSLYTKTPEEAESFLRPTLTKGSITDPTLSGLLGLGVDVGTDPTTYALGPALKGAGKLGELAAETKTGKAVGLIKDAVQEKTGNFLSKAGETLTGVPKGDIKTFSEQTDKIMDMAKKYENDVATASDSMRQKWAQQIRAGRQKLNGIISDSIDANHGGKTVDPTSVIEALEDAKANINPKYDKDGSIPQIQDMIDKIKGNGEHSVGDYYAMKQELQEMASGAYQKDGQIFMPGKGFQRAAKSAGAEANSVLLDVAPEIKGADNKLSQLRQIEKRLNKNTLAEGKPVSNIMAAGSGANPMQAAQLAKLEELTGGTMKSDAERLSAMRSFGSPSWLPVDTTGKSVARQILGRQIGAGLLGGGAGYEGGGLGGVLPGAGAGLLLSSPAALKQGILMSQRAKGLLSGVASNPRLLNAILSEEKARNGSQP